MLVLLHGLGSNENDLMGLAPYLDGRFLIVSLRAPLMLDHGSYGWFKIDWQSDGLKFDESGAALGQKAAERSIEELADRYDVDPIQVYLCGFSQGAIESLAIALTSPEKIAGAVIMSGALLTYVVDEVVSAQQLDGLSIMVVHGLYDTVLPVEFGREIKTFLKTTSVDLDYREYPMPHTVSEESLSDVADWLAVKLNTGKH
jgi:phospholipase/carboxylesterase